MKPYTLGTLIHVLMYSATTKENSDYTISTSGNDSLYFRISRDYQLRFSLEMKMLVALVILLAPAISGQDMPGSSCNLTILSDFPACSNSYQGFFLNSSVDDAAIDLICNNASCQMAITAYINSCDNTTDQQVSGME